MNLDLSEVETITVEGDDISSVYAWAGDTLSLVWSKAGALSIEATNVYGGGSSASAIPVQTNATLATVTGGQEPYTFAVTRDGASGDTWVINGPISSNSRFTASAVSAYTTQTETFQIEVTDNRGDTASTIITATAENFGAWA